MASYGAYLLDKNGNSIFFDKKPDLSKGDLYVSTSQILNMLGGNDFLVTWALKTFGGHADPYAQYQRYMEKVSDLGSRLHLWVECDLKGISFPEEKLNEDLIPGIESWLKFKSENDIELIYSEKVVHSKKLRIAGTVDQVIRLNGDICICDLKSGSVMPKAFIQLRCYKTMLQEMGLADGSEKLIVLGGADSKTKISEGGPVLIHTIESMFGPETTEEDLYRQLLCLRELWFQANAKSKKWAPVIKGFQEYLDPIIEDFRDSFRQLNQKGKKKNGK